MFTYRAFEGTRVKRKRKKMVVLAERVLNTNTNLWIYIIINLLLRMHCNIIINVLHFHLTHPKISL